jgi:hypothetical protein
MRHHFCTYFDRNYLAKGLALIESLTRHCADLTIYVVCMDEYTRVVLNALSLPNVRTIPLHEVEGSDPDLAACRHTRTVVEYIWTTTPAIITHVLNRFSEIERLVYVDADLYFFSDPSAIYHEMGHKTVLIHAHRFHERNMHLTKFGTFNVGLLVFTNTASARAVLHDWRVRCIEWCHDYAEDGKFGDQGYLDAWPSTFPQVLVTNNVGVGVAPWNHENYRYSGNSRGEPCVDGTPIVFYHYHSFKVLNLEVFAPAPDAGWHMPADCVKLCFVPYIEALRRAYARIQALVGDFPFGYAPKSFSLSLDHVVLSSRMLVPELQRIGFSQPIADLDSQWVAFQGAQWRGSVDSTPSIV